MKITQPFKSFLLIFLLFSKLSLADTPCSKAPCDLASDKSVCIAQADWIVEGTLWDAYANVKTICQTLSTPQCQEIRDADTIVIEKILVTKGQIEKKSNLTSAVINGGSHCWKAATNFPKTAKQERFRFYGKNQFQLNWAQAGFFAWEKID